MKRITLSIIQFVADIKNGNYEGVKKFIHDFEPLYTSLFKQYKYDESEFKKEIQDIFEYLFSNGNIYEVAQSLFIKNGDIEIFMDTPHIKPTPLMNKIDEIRRNLGIMVMKWDGSSDPEMKNIRWEKNPLYFLPTGEYYLSNEEYIKSMEKFKRPDKQLILGSSGTNPLKAFIFKYQYKYSNKEKDLSLQEKALIAAYNVEGITREKGKLYIWYSYYLKRTNRIAIETTRKKTSNKIERIEKIIPYLSNSLQCIAKEEVSILRTRLEKETF